MRPPAPRAKLRAVIGRSRPASRAAGASAPRVGFLVWAGLALFGCGPPDEPQHLLGEGGFRDPDRPFHGLFGGIPWAVQDGEVLLVGERLVGSTRAVAACMARFGRSVVAWADRESVSRASVYATAAAESNCTNPPGSTDGRSSGPMQVTGTTCQDVTGLAPEACKLRMHLDPDFSFEVGTRYIASAYQRTQHDHDPPKIAAAYNAGSLRPTVANRWHMITAGNHLDRFVAAYNAYRAWERLGTPAPD